MRETATEAMTFSTDHLRPEAKRIVTIYRKQLAKMTPGSPEHRELEQLLLRYRAN